MAPHRLDNERNENVQPVTSEGCDGFAQGLMGTTTAALVAVLVVGLGATAFAVETSIQCRGTQICALSSARYASELDG